tara:strand:+ start:4390 stop:4860 length:471 start_codon:yes stop_codon:yes gene_type:complete
MVARGGKKGGQTAPQPKWYEKPLRSSKGQFNFTLVTDGVYVEHKWGQNSGHIGIPKETIPQFIKYLQTFAPAAKSTGEAAGVSEKGKVISKENKKPKKVAKKEPEMKPTMDDLDADLMSYQSARTGGEAEAEMAEPAAVPATEPAAAEAPAADVAL